MDTVLPQWFRGIRRHSDAKLVEIADDARSNGHGLSKAGRRVGYARFMIEVRAAACARAMELIPMLNCFHRFQGLV